VPASPTTIVNLAQFVGEDKLYQDTIVQADGVTPQDITNWGVSFKVTAYDDPTAVYISKSTAGGGITLVTPLLGVLQILVQSTDTAGMYPGSYRYAIERVDVGNDAVLTAGLLTLLSR
jgi:hypothetical protein